MLLKKQILISAIVSLCLVVPFGVSARGLVPCGGYKDAAGTQREDPCTLKDMFVLVAIATNWLIGVAGLYAVFKIIQGGFWLIASMGNEEKITKSKGQITDAVVGFVLVLFAFMFINTVVNFLLTRDIAIKKNPNCKLDLTDPWKYLTIEQNPCSNLPDTIIHTP